MTQAKPKEIFLKDYVAPDYKILKLDLTIDIFDGHTIVTSLIESQHTDGKSFSLDGEDLELLSIQVNDEEFTSERYKLDNKSLTLYNLPQKAKIVITNKIEPEKNKTLSGLYKSSGMYCTQCEAEGFRRITYFPDRPDVLTVYTTKIIADIEKYPVLLANGNLIESGTQKNNRHYAVYNDPFPKPSYLFAMVAGNLIFVEDTFLTRSKRLVKVQIYVEHRNIQEAPYCLSALKKAMKFDEEAFDREYDLDVYMIVAVDDFNMGAMENKGLNIFNSSCVLASEQTSTDLDFAYIDAVVGHEYFHNWSGNRVTCRDWFQLSLKEGFTVYREHKFCESITNPIIARIDAVSHLRTYQFKEDAGPLSHPVRPESFVEINNFYTTTIYEKGAEVIRMLELIIGKSCFKKAVNEYFKRFDGMAVTTDDFVQVMSEVSGKDLTKFKLWYSQAGTPLIRVEPKFDEKNKQYLVKITQEIPDTPGQTNKDPMHIPIQAALYHQDGKLIENTSRLLELTSESATFEFNNINEKPKLSILQGFSAPVKVEFERGIEDLNFCVKYDQDGFSRFDAMQNIYKRVILDIILNEGDIDSSILDTIKDVMKQNIENNIKASILSLPNYNIISQELQTIYPMKIYLATKKLKSAIALYCEEELCKLYEQNASKEQYAYVPELVAKRALCNTALSYLLHTYNAKYLEVASSHYYAANNMTDTMAVLSNIVNFDHSIRGELLLDFSNKWINNHNLMNKWFSVQARSELIDTCSSVKLLTRHESFSYENPNRVRALIGAFCNSNPTRFHDKSGSGYDLLAETIKKLNKINPQIAARMVNPLVSYAKYEDDLSNLMRNKLVEISNLDNLSKDVGEIVTRALNSNA